jgi:hypothetical protein
MTRIVQLLNSRKEHITIVQTGANEYMVLVKGTDFEHWNRSNNGIAALQSGSELPSHYERQVRELIQAKVPPGASIHFVGHSLGGIVAHNLTDNQDFNQRYHVESVTTFGTPQSAMMRPGVEYHRFRNEHDIVPKLDGGLALPHYADIGQNVGELTSQQVVHSGHTGIADAHAMEHYALAPELAGIPPPRNLDLSHWQDARIVGSSSPTVNSPAFANSKFFTVVDNTASGIAAVGLSLANRTVEVGSTYLPAQWRDPIDRYNDRVKYFLMENTPTPSQALGAVVDVYERGERAARRFFSTF